MQLDHTDLIFDLKCINVFRKGNLTKDQFLELIDAMQVQSFKKGDDITILNQNIKAALYLVLSGGVWLERAGMAPVKLPSGCNFGEEMLAAAEGKPSAMVTAPYTVKSDSCTCAILTMDACRGVFDIDQVEKALDVKIAMSVAKKKLETPSADKKAVKKKKTDNEDSVVSSKVKKKKKKKKKASEEGEKDVKKPKKLPKLLEGKEMKDATPKQTIPSEQVPTPEKAPDVETKSQEKASKNEKDDSSCIETDGKDTDELSLKEVFGQRVDNGDKESDTSFHFSKELSTTGFEESSSSVTSIRERFQSSGSSKMNRLGHSSSSLDMPPRKDCLESRGRAPSIHRGVERSSSALCMSKSDLSFDDKDSRPGFKKTSSARFNLEEKQPSVSSARNMFENLSSPKKASVAQKLGSVATVQGPLGDMLKETTGALNSDFTSVEKSDGPLTVAKRNSVLSARNIFERKPQPTNVQPDISTTSSTSLQSRVEKSKEVTSTKETSPVDVEEGHELQGQQKTEKRNSIFSARSVFENNKTQNSKLQPVVPSTQKPTVSSYFPSMSSPRRRPEPFSAKKLPDIATVETKMEDTTKSSTSNAVVPDELTKPEANSADKSLPGPLFSSGVCSSSLQVTDKAEATAPSTEKSIVSSYLASASSPRRRPTPFNAKKLQKTSKVDMAVEDTISALSSVVPEEPARPVQPSSKCNPHFDQKLPSGTLLPLSQVEDDAQQPVLSTQNTIVSSYLAPTSSPHRKIAPFNTTKSREASKGNKTVEDARRTPNSNSMQGESAQPVRASSEAKPHLAPPLTPCTPPPFLKVQKESVEQTSSNVSSENQLTADDEIKAGENETSISSVGPVSSYDGASKPNLLGKSAGHEQPAGDNALSLSCQNASEEPESLSFAPDTVSSVIGPTNSLDVQAHVQLSTEAVLAEHLTLYKETSVVEESDPSATQHPEVNVKEGETSNRSTESASETKILRIGEEEASKALETTVNKPTEPNSPQANFDTDDDERSKPVSLKQNKSKTVSSADGSSGPKGSEPQRSENQEAKRPEPPDRPVKKTKGKDFSSFLSARKKFEARVARNGSNIGARPPRNVFQNRVTLPKDYKPPVYPKTEKEEKRISSALKKRFVFKNLPEHTIGTLISAFESKHVPEGKIIVEQGKVDDYFYVVAEGECQFEVDGVKTDIAKKGDSFGEDALVFLSPRDASVRANKDTDLFQVDQKTFRCILQSEMTQNEKNKRDILKKVECLQGSTPESINKLTSIMVPVDFEKGDTLAKSNHFGNKFHFITEGKVECRDVKFGRKSKPNKVLGPGEYFGKHALVEDPFMKADVVALTSGKAYTIEREKKDRVLGTTCRAPIEARIISCVRALERIEFKPLSYDETMKISSLVRDVSYKKGDIIIEPNTEQEAAVYFLREGKVHTERGRQLVLLTPGNFFGDTIFQEAKDKKITTGKMHEKVIADTDVICGVIRIRDYYEAFGDKFKDTSSKLKAEIALADTSTSRRGSKKAKGSAKKAVEKSKKAAHRHIPIDNLDKSICLGEGEFGQIWLCADKTEKKPCPYVLKIMSKAHLVSEGQAEMCIREKTVLADVSHPFIVELVSTYNEKAFVFMLLEFVQGGELFSVMNSSEGRIVLKESQAKFYALGIADALAYLHQKKYVYRDLKPENVMIDSMGYPKLIDFGFAKKVLDHTFTLCGTPGYLAPELVSSRGHNWAVDHWALGVLIYEMVSDSSPFYEDGIEQFELFRSIAEDDFPYIENLSHPAYTLISGLLEKDPSNRLGSFANGEKDILEHAWFEEIDVTKLRQCEIEAPWKPKVNDPFDTSNFDDWSGVEDKMLDAGERISKKNEALFDGF